MARIHCLHAVPLLWLLAGCQSVGPERSAPQAVVANPPTLGQAAAEGLRRTRPAVEATRTAPRDLSLDLDIVYTDGELWNPATLRNDKVRLRSYQGTAVDPLVPFISPTLEVQQGSTLRITLNNRLPADPSCAHGGHDINVPHCFNGTNLHTHGLWVSPAGKSDNVLVSIDPQQYFEYEYEIPADHPAGTFWYHTHRHGSTALQVSSGMAGALIVRGERLPGVQANGDIDTLLRPGGPAGFNERIVVLQQIQYACRDADGKIKTDPQTGHYLCEPGDVGAIENYDVFGLTGGSSNWALSGRYTSINGRVLPTFSGVQTGQVERWRVIHGGVRDTVNLEFRKLQPQAPSALGLSAEQQDAYVDQQCTGEPLAQHLIAADGLTTDAVKVSAQTMFQPGYRWDALMVFPEPGRYCVIDTAAPAAATISGGSLSRQLLAVVEVAGEPISATPTVTLTQALLDAAEANMPAGTVRDKVVAELRDGLKLTSFVPHADIADSELTGTQEMVFNIQTQPTLEFQVNGKPFAADRIDRILPLGGVDEWTLQSLLASHPFHIHVNPFQVVKILDPNGKDVSAPDAVDDAGGAADSQYPGLKGVWKDTLWVKNLGAGEAGMYTLVVRTRYQRFSGDFVLHCHILDHEDQGMMQLIRIASPEEANRTAAPAHRH